MCVNQKQKITETRIMLSLLSTTTISIRNMEETNTGHDNQSQLLQTPCGQKLHIHTQQHKH